MARRPAILAAIAIALTVGGAAAQVAPERFTPAPPLTASVPLLTPAGPVPGPPLSPRGALLPTPAPLGPSDRVMSVPVPAAPSPSPAIASAPPPPPTPPPRKPVAAARTETSQAAPKRRGTVYARESVYVRAEPRRDARIVDGLVTGDAVDLVPPYGDVDGWTRVGRGGEVLGYIRSPYLLSRRPSNRATGDDAACSFPDGFSADEAALASGARARARVDSFMRAEPSCTARVLDVLERGDVVTILEAEDGWYAVRSQGWPRAYIGSRLLGPAEPR